MPHLLLTAPHQPEYTLRLCPFYSVSPKTTAALSSRPQLSFLCPSHLSPTRDLPPPSLSGYHQPGAAQSPEAPLPPRGCAPRQREGCQMVHRSTGHAWQILQMKNHPHTQFTDSLHLTLGLTPVCPAPVDLIFKEAHALFLRLVSAILPDSPLPWSWGTKVTGVTLMLATKPRTHPPPWPLWIRLLTSPVIL